MLSSHQHLTKFGQSELYIYIIIREAIEFTNRKTYVWTIFNPYTIAYTASST